MVSWPNTLLHGRGAAVGLAFYNVLGAIGGFISPYIVGRLSNGGSYNSSMYVQGAFNLAAALMILGEHIPSCQASVLKCRVAFNPFHNSVANFHALRALLLDASPRIIAQNNTETALVAQLMSDLTNANALAIPCSFLALGRTRA